MRFNIDFSVVLEDGAAFGYVDGQLELAILPETGDVLSFGQSSRGGAIPDGSILGGQLRVTGRVFNAASSNDLTVTLENMCIADIESAQRIGAYFEEEFGLFFTPYGE